MPALEARSRRRRPFRSRHLIAAPPALGARGRRLVRRVAVAVQSRVRRGSGSGSGSGRGRLASWRVAGSAGRGEERARGRHGRGRGGCVLTRIGLPSLQ